LSEAARRAETAKRLRSRGSRLCNDRRDSGGERVGPGAGGVDGGAGLGETRVAEGLSAGRGGGESGLRAG